MKIIIVNCSDTFEHRALLLRDVFVKQGHTAHVITSDFRHIQKVQRTETPDGVEMLHVLPYKRNLSVERLASHHKWGNDAYKKLVEYAPDMIWAMIPPNSTAKAAAKYKKAHPECKLVFDVIDMWPESLPITNFKDIPPLSLWGDLRNKNLKYADAVVTECDLYWDVLGKYYPREKGKTIYLAKEITPFNSNVALPDDQINLCYLGSINNIIDIDCICDIIKKIDMPVCLHIIGDGEKKDELIEAVQNTGAQVVYHGKIYDCAQKQAIFDICHFGLNIMKDTVYVGLTMKSLDYFEGGLPIINNIKGDTWKFVENEKVGINFMGQANVADILTTAQNSRSGVRDFFERSFTQEIFERKILKIIGQME